MGQDDGTKTTVETLEARLDAARARRAALEEQRAARLREAELRVAVEREERAAVELEKLAELEDEHGPVGERIWRLDTSHGMIVLRAPTPTKYRAFVDKGKTTQNAQEQFAREFLLYPDKARFNEMVEATPAVVGRCCDALIYLAGWRDRGEVAGK